MANNHQLSTGHYEVRYYRVDNRESPLSPQVEEEVQKPIVVEREMTNTPSVAEVNAERPATEDDQSCDGPYAEITMPSGLSRFTLDLRPVSIQARDGPLPIRNLPVRAIPSEIETFTPLEYVPSTRKPGLHLVPTARQWEAYKQALARAHVIARIEANLERPMRQGSKEWDDAIADIDVEEELKELRGPGKGYPHAVKKDAARLSRWHYLVEKGDDPE